MKQQLGISLIEILVVLVIVGIVVGLSLPSFTVIVNRSKQEESAVALINALAIARSEAVVRGRQVQVSPNAVSDSPAGTGKYTGGVWSVSLVDGSPAFPGGDLSPVIKVYEVSEIDEIYTATDPDVATAFVFNPSGTLKQTAKIALCQSGEIHCKQVKVNLVGRAQLATVDKP